MNKNIISKELTMIVEPHREMKVLAVATKVLAEYGATLAKIESKGTQRLAYTIEGHKVGGHVYIEYFVDEGLSRGCAKALDKALSNCDEAMTYQDITVFNARHHEANLDFYYTLYWHDEAIEQAKVKNED